MPGSLTREAVRSLANPLRSDLSDIRAKDAMVRTDANSLPDPAGFGPARSIVREVMRRASLSQKAFAINAKQSESVISEALGGSRHLSIDWLWAQDESFWVHFRDVVTEAKQLCPTTQKQVRAAHVAELVRILLEGVA